MSKLGFETGNVLSLLFFKNKKRNTRDVTNLGKGNEHRGQQ